MSGDLTVPLNDLDREEGQNGQIPSMFERCDLSAFDSEGGIKGFAKKLRTDLENGLPKDEENSNFEKRKAEFGINSVPEPKKESWCRMFLGNLSDIMLRVYFVAAALSAVITTVFPPGGSISFSDYIETISIFSTVFLVAAIEAQTKYAQQKAFLEVDCLKSIFNVTVIRHSEEMQILNTEVLVGDILCLHSGDLAPADSLFISGRPLKMNNSLMTGESESVTVNEAFPFIIGGAGVESGNAHALVAAVGNSSQSGILLTRVQNKDEKESLTPLKKKLIHITKVITYIGTAGSAVTFVVLVIYWIVSIAHTKWNSSCLNGLLEILLNCITEFICVIPEGLPLAVTISLGFSMRRMMKDNNFVRYLNACETMGGATAICTDKTGTLTQNSMTVVDFFQFGDEGLSSKIADLFSECVSTDTTAFSNAKDGKFVGQSSEVALLQKVQNLGFDYKEIRAKLPVQILHEFSSSRKCMSVVVRYGPGFRCYVKGAPEMLLDNCQKYIDSSGEVHQITESNISEIKSKLSNIKSVSTILLAYKDLKGSAIKQKWYSETTVERKLTLIGIVSIMDPLRPEASKAIADCKRAGVIVRMVTGDNAITAQSIAKECGILLEGDITMEGKEFCSMSKLELLEVLPKLKVLARSSPQDKVRLVSLLMESGEVVAVTGDGSNDSAALKKANVGLSMGKCGTELAKMASDIVILDDNFNSIVNALKWGRCIYNNVKAFIQFQLTINLSAISICFIGSLLYKESPLKTIQILWIDFIMDTLGALALSTRGPTDALLDRPAYGSSESLASNIIIRNVTGQAVFQIGVALVILLESSRLFGISDQSLIFTMVFNTYVFCQVFNLINSRVTNDEINPFAGVNANKLFFAVLFGIVTIQILIIEFISTPFSVVHLNLKQWGISVGMAFGSIPIGFILRLIKLPDHTAEKLHDLRTNSRNEMLQKYKGVSAEQQWDPIPTSPLK